MEATALPRAAAAPGSARLLRLAGDDRLVALIRSGNGAAFEAVYERYQRPLLSFCRHMLGQPEEAADAVQHTFLSAYRDLTASDKPIQLRAWLFTIARNRSLSMLRARRQTTSLEDVAPATEGLAADVERRAELRDLLGDLRLLPDDQRAALVLSELGALGHDEIAAVIDCPREKVKALVFQARTSLASSREARDTPCAEVREQLATLRGGALRRATLRRHVRACPGCRQFREEVRRQREAMAILLPVAPAVGLRDAVLSGAGLAGGGAAAGAGAGAGGILSGLGAAGAKGLAVKALIAALIVGGGAAGSVALVKGGASSPSGAHRSAASGSGSGSESGSGAAPAGPVLTKSVGSVAAAVASAGGPGAVAAEQLAAARGRSDAARANALANGNGLKRGLRGTQPGQGRNGSSSNGRGRSDSAPGQQPEPGTPATPSNSSGGDNSGGGGPQGSGGQGAARSDSSAGVDLPLSVLPVTGGGRRGGA